MLINLDLTPLFKDVYQEVDDNLKEFLYEGSTATTVIIWRNPKTNKKYVQCANLGDSTCFLIRNGISLSFLSLLPFPFFPFSDPSID